MKYGRNTAIGVTKDGFGTDDKTQSVWGLDVTAGMHQATLGLSYQKVSQSGNDYVSSWSGETSSEVDGGSFFGPNSMMISDFKYDGEKSWGVHAGYDFAGMVDGLSVSMAYAKGDIKTKAGVKGNEKEYNLKASYALPQVENLSVSAQYAKNTTKADVSGVKSTNKQVRVIAKYDFSVF